MRFDKQSEHEFYTVIFVTSPLFPLLEHSSLGDTIDLKGWISDSGLGNLSMLLPQQCMDVEPPAKRIKQ